jgi:hypothetical protein
MTTTLQLRKRELATGARDSRRESAQTPVRIDHVVAQVRETGFRAQSLRFPVLIP